MIQTFVSRNQELSRLDSLLELAVSGKGQVCFVTGEAGTGKTSITAEFARRAQQADKELLVAIGDCNSQTGISDPYLPFREVLGMLAGDVEDRVAQGMTTEENASRVRSFLRVTKKIMMDVGPDLIDIFVPGVGLATKAGVLVAGDEEMLWRKRRGAPTAETAGSPVQTVADSEQGRIFEQVTRVLVSLAAERPLILILDDLHWIDDSSASLLFHLARRIEGSRILVIGTYRPEEVAMERGEYRHPMAQIVAELKRHYGDLMISLGQEASEEAREFIDNLIDTEPNALDQSFRKKLYDKTKGHPLFTTELLRDMQERGALEKDQVGKWVPGQNLDWSTLPARTEGVIEERVNRLPDNLQEILAIASVQGEEFTAQVIQQLTDLSEREVVSALTRDLVRTHRLVVEEGTVRVGSTRLSRFRFRHQMFREYFYERLGAAERELLHEDVAKALEHLHADKADRIAVQLAHQFELAGLCERASSYYLQAGTRALAVFAYSEALSLATMGLDCLKRLDDFERHAEAALELQLLQGDALKRSGKIQESMESFRQTAESALSLRAPEAAAKGAMGYSESCWRYNMVDSTSVRLLTDALTLLDKEDSRLRACLIAYIARTSEKLKSLDELLAILDEAIAMARRLGDPGTLIECARFRFSLDRDPTRMEERRMLADEMLELAKQVGNDVLRLDTLLYRVMDNIAIGNLEACERDVEAILQKSTDLGDPFYGYMAEMMRVSGAILIGHFEEAERLALGAMESGQRLGVDNVEGVMGVQMFTIRREQGRLREMAPLVSHFLDEHGIGATWRPGLTLLYLEIGESEKAKEQFERMAGTDFGCVPKDALWQTCLGYLAEVCDTLNDQERAQILYDLLLPYKDLNMVVGNGSACLGATSRFLGQLATVMHRWDEARAHFEHAIEFNERLNAQPWLAHTWFQYALMLERRGRSEDRGRATELIGKAEKTAERLGMVGLLTKIRGSLSAL